MIDSTTDIIFLDEAYAGLLDVDDWKLLCQGGYTSHDSKWKKAQGFHSKATMFITCQEEMDFGEVHNPAMDRRLHKYYFKSLPDVKPEANQWLKENAMHCIVWAAKQVVNSTEQLEESNSEAHEDGLTDEDLLNITSVHLLNDDEASEEIGSTNSDSSDEEEDDKQSRDSGSDLETVDSSLDMDLRILQNNIKSCDESSLRARMLRILLESTQEVRRSYNRVSRSLDKRQVEFRRKGLVEFGVLEEEAASRRITDANQPLSPDLQKRYDRAVKKKREQEQVEYQMNSTFFFFQKYMQALNVELFYFIYLFIFLYLQTLRKNKRSKKKRKPNLCMKIHG